MQRKLISLAVLACLGAAVSAQAATVSATFSGLVQSQVASGLTVGSPVAGSFVWETTTNSFTSFTVAGRTISPGYTSSATLTPDGYSALYQAQISPVVGGTTNQTWTLDLEGIAPWFATAQTNGIAVLLAGNLQSNLDTTLSVFSFYSANADGTNVQSMAASLSAITVVPEPATWLLLASGVAALLVRRRFHTV